VKLFKKTWGENFLDGGCGAIIPLPEQHTQIKEYAGQTKYRAG